MMASFEDYKVWKKASELSVRLYDLNSRLETAAIIFLIKNCEL